MADRLRILAACIVAATLIHFAALIATGGVVRVVTMGEFKSLVERGRIREAYVEAGDIAQASFFARAEEGTAYFVHRGHGERYAAEATINALGMHRVCSMPRGRPPFEAKTGECQRSNGEDGSPSR